MKNQNNTKLCRRVAAEVKTANIKLPKKQNKQQQGCVRIGQIRLLHQKVRDETQAQ